MQALDEFVTDHLKFCSAPTSGWPVTWVIEMKICKFAKYGLDMKFPGLEFITYSQIVFQKYSMVWI